MWRLLPALVVWALAVLPALADEAAVERAYLARLNELVGDAANNQIVMRQMRAGDRAAVTASLRAALDNYLEQAVPTDDGRREAFLEVVEATVRRADAAFLEDLRFAGTQAPTSNTGIRLGLPALLDPIAFRVAENPRAALRAARRDPAAWRRQLDAARPRAANATPSINTVPAAVATDPREAERWVSERYDALLRDFERRVDAPAAGAGLRRDLGRLLHLMTERNANGGLVVLDHLAALGADLADDGADLSASPPGAGPTAELAAYKRLKKALTDALAAREAEHGFRGEVLPTGILSEDDFLSLTAAGYVLDDIGARREHGALSHRLQWYAVMAAFEASPGDWYHTPLELYTTIGAFDRDLFAQNAERRFGFERQGSLWAAIFDQAGTASTASLRQPDNLVILLDPGRREALLDELADSTDEAAFERFADTLTEVDRLRLRRMEGLLAEAKVELGARRSAWRFITGARASDAFGLSIQELRQIVERQAEIAREELFVLDYEAQRRGELVQARTRDNRPLPILVDRSSPVIDRDADEDALGEQRASWRDELRSAEPAHPHGGGAAAAPADDHDAAPGPERGEAPFNDFDDEFADAGEPPFPGDDAFEGADDDHDRAREIGESLPNVPGEEPGERDASDRDDEGFETADELSESEERRPERRAEAGRI